MLGPIKPSDINHITAQPSHRSSSVLAKIIQIALGFFRKLLGDAKSTEKIRVTNPPQHVKRAQAVGEKKFQQEVTQAVDLVSKDGLNLKKLPSHLRDHLGVVLAAVRQNGETLQYAGKNCRSDPRVALLALEQNPKAVSWIDPKLLKLSHKNLIDFAQKLGYLSNKTGICYGVSLMGVQAFLLNEFDRFEYRLNKLALLAKQQEIDPSTWIELDFDLLPFFEGIELYFQGDKYSELFPNTDTPQSQSDPKLIPSVSQLMMPEALQKQGGIKEVFNWAGVYGHESFVKHLDLMKPLFAANDSLALDISSIDHSGCLKYDVKEKKWLFIDANHLSKRRFRRSNDLVKYLFNSPNLTAFNTRIMTTQEKSQNPKFQQALKTWQTDLTFQKIHKCPQSGELLENLLELILTFGNISSLKYYQKLGFNLLDLFEKPDLLSVAILNNQTSILSWLFKELGDRRPKNIDDQLLDLAIKRNNLEALKILIHAGVNLDLPPPYKAPLISAIQNKNLEMIRELVQAGVALNAQDKVIELTPLQLAIEIGLRDVVKLLLDKGADPNISYPNGESPLIVALERKQRVIAAALIRAGAQRDVKSEEGQTALEIAKKLGLTEIVYLLES